MVVVCCSHTKRISIIASWKLVDWLDVNSYIPNRRKPPHCRTIHRKCPKSACLSASSVPEPPCANGCQHIPRSRREKKKRNFASVTNYRLQHYNRVYFLFLFIFQCIQICRYHAESTLDARQYLRQYHIVHEVKYYLHLHSTWIGKC